MSTPKEAAAPAAPTKSRKGLVMATIALVVLLGGGGGAYWKFVAHKAPVDPKAEEAKAKAEEKAKHEASAVAVPFEPFVVNLADPGGTRFLRVTLSLVVHEAEKAKELEEAGVHQMKVRSAILELLSLQHADRLITPDGKSELKKTIAEAADKAVAELHVSDVLFSEFVVQF
jgi:flagellar FliL protein